MKRTITKTATLALALFSFTAFSQEKIQPCNTYEAMEQHFSSDPQARKNYEIAQEQLRLSHMELEKNMASKSAAAAFEYTVPVVFHVLYGCNAGIISDATIIQALDQANKDFARLSSDTNLIAQPFRSSYINSEIKFMLAKKDPQGNCINGIVRHEDAKTKWFQAQANGVGSNAYWPYTWDPTKYLNVYLVAEIVPQSTVTGGGTVIGYTFKPGTWNTGNPHDAIVYDMDFLSGTSGQAPSARSLSHEMGHWLNLAHTWGNTNNPGINCGDDGVMDTPITKGEFGGCASSSISVCTQITPSLTGLNNVQNIMNYSDCPRNFTTGQTTVMRNALASVVSGRSNLYAPATLVFTDVDGTGSCRPEAEFYSTNCSYTVCKGASLSFKDFSNSSITNVAWSADNGAVIASPNASITSIMFPNLGTSDVTVTVTNAVGIDTKVKTVTVIDNTPGFGPISMESFETPAVVPPNWSVVNEDNDAVLWTQTGNAGYDQTSSFMVEGANNQPNHSDILQTPIMDVLNNQNNIFQFAYAYRQESTTQNDVLRIEGSRDCGGTWQTIFTLNANLMQNGSGGIGTDDFVPATNEWKVYVLSSHPNWQNYKTSSNVMVRFNFIEGTNGFGNNMYIDAVNFYNTVGFNELTNSIRFNMSPNPTTGEANLNFNLNDPANISVSVLDIMGREVLPAMQATYGAGEQTITINKNNTLAKGVYFVNLSLNGAKISSKLVID